MAVLFASSIPSGASTGGTPFDLRDQNRCLTGAPAPASPPAGRTLRLLVVFDGPFTPANEATARAVIERADDPFTTGPLAPGVAFAASYAYAGIQSGAEVRSDVLDADPAGDDVMSALIRWRRANPSPAADHVHLLTRKDLYVEADGSRQTSIVGMANCVGSIGAPDISFSVSEIGISPRHIGPVTLAANGDAKVAAHEIGHAFGAQHAYANCAETAGLDATSSGACTLMINDLSLAALRFSAVSSAVIAGRARASLG